MVTPVSSEDATQFVESYLEGFSKHLTTVQVDLIRQASWLRDLGGLVLVLEELRRFGRVEALDDRIQELVNCKTGPEIAEQVLAGLRPVLPVPWRKSADCAILAMRTSLRGLQETEIRETAALATSTSAALPSHLWSAIRIALGSALISRGTLCDIATGPVQDWADSEYARQPGAVREIARALARALERSPRRRWEEAPKIAGVLGKHGLEELLTDKDNVLALLEIGENFAAGWLDRLDPDARARTAAGWAKNFLLMECPRNRPFGLGCLPCRRAKTMQR